MSGARGSARFAVVRIALADAADALTSAQIRARELPAPRGDVLIALNGAAGAVRDVERELDRLEAELDAAAAAEVAS